MHYQGPAVIIGSIEGRKRQYQIDTQTIRSLYMTQHQKIYTVYFCVVIYGLLKEESRILIIFMSETQYGGTESVTYCWPKEKQNQGKTKYYG